MTRPWDAREALQLNPVTETICSGTTQRNEPCRNPITHRNRVQAAKLFDDLGNSEPGTPQAQELIRQIAPKMLCLRMHQHQADKLIEVMQRRMCRAAMDAHRARRNATAQTQRQNTPSRPSGSASGSAIRTREGIYVQHPSPSIPSIPSVSLPQTGDLAERMSQLRVDTAQQEAPSTLPFQFSAGGRLGDAHSEARETPRRWHLQRPVEVPAHAAPHPRSSEQWYSSAAALRGFMELAAPPMTAAQPVPVQTSMTCPAEHVSRRVLDECPICTDALTLDDDLVWCKSGCGTNYHKTCQQTWASTQMSQIGYTTCASCRSRWQNPCICDMAEPGWKESDS